MAELLGSSAPDRSCLACGKTFRAERKNGAKRKGGQGVQRTVSVGKGQEKPNGKGIGGESSISGSHIKIILRSTRCDGTVANGRKHVSKVGGASAAAAPSTSQPSYERLVDS
eukprot:4530823-Pleurochrysis_carterae.AAC.1